MSTGVSNDGIRDAIVRFLGDGILPETEEIVSSHFSKAFGKDVLGHISQVRDEVEVLFFSYIDRLCGILRISLLFRLSLKH